jgi:hypothetical protein
MFKVTLPSNDDFYCLCNLTGLPLGQSLIITNNTNSQIRVNRVSVKPEDPLLGFPVWPGQTILVHGNEEQPVWTRGNTNGYILVQTLTETMMPLTGVEFPQDIVTSGIEGFRRLQVDTGQTGFFEGREFRFLRKIRSGITFKFVSAVDFVLYEQVFGISSGAYEFHAWRVDNVEETASFGTDLSQHIINKNASGEYRDYNGDRYQTQVSISSGGTLAINDVELYTDYAEMRTAGSTAQRASVNQGGNTQRYLPAGTYYLSFTVLDALVRGTYQIGWEERPSGVK